MIAVRHPLWRKAPARLLRYPALFAAIALGAMLVVVVSTAYPLFLSASDSDLLASTMARPSFTPYGSGLGYRSTRIPFDATGPDGGSLLQERQDAFREAAAEDPSFGPVVESLAAREVGVGLPDDPTGPSTQGRLFAGTEVLQHVQIVAGSDGDGVWLPDSIAGTLHVQPGDTVELRNGPHRVEVGVDGIYVALSNQTPDGYWQIWQDQLRSGCSDCAPPPQFILADPAQVLDLQTQLHRPSADQAFVAPARTSPPLTLDEARTLRTTVAGLQGQMQDRASYFGILFPCCGPLTTAGARSTTSLISQTANLVRIVEGRSAGLRGPAAVLLLAGLTIAFVVVCAAGVFSFSSRPSEAAVLSVRGWGPGRVASKAATESALPVIVGAVAGFVVAYALVLTIGPNGPVEPAARTTAVVASLAAVLGALAVIGATNAAMFVAHHEHRERLWRFFLWIPWELIAFGALIVFGRSLHSGGALVGSGEVQRPGAPVFLYPIAFATAVGILVARAAAVAIVWRARTRGGTGVTARWMAVRRVASSVRLAVVFLIAAAVAVSVSVSAQALVSSLRTTVVAKAKIFVGSDVQAQVVPGAVPPTSFPYPLTQVERVQDGGHFDEVATESFQLLVVDPSTFADAAFWNDALSDSSLDDMMEGLMSGEDGDGAGSLPIVIANGSDFRPSTITIGVAQVPVTVVGRAVSFPGSLGQGPVVVVSRDAALDALPAGSNLLTMGGNSTELWIAGPTAGVLDALGRSDIGVFSVVTADQVRDIPFIVAAVNTFLTLDVLGVMSLLLIVVLAVGYLHVRQRPRVVASGLSSRMGVSPRMLRRALALELGGVLLGALAIGVPTGLIASAVVLRSMDPLSLIPPQPFFAAPWIGVIAVGILLVLAAVVGSWVVDRATRHADLAEVMRVAG